MQLPDGRIRRFLSNRPARFRRAGRGDAARIDRSGPRLQARRTAGHAESARGLAGTRGVTLAAVQRELMEETGYTASEWLTLARFVVDGNRECGTAHVFLARNAIRVAAVTTDDTEDLDVVLMSPPNEVLRAVRSGEVALLASVGALALPMVMGLD